MAYYQNTGGGSFPEVYNPEICKKFMRANCLTLKFVNFPCREFSTVHVSAMFQIYNGRHGQYRGSESYDLDT